MSESLETGAPAYFASSDGAIESILRPTAIGTSLVFNLLFEPAGILVPDIFFFNNDFFTDHVLNYQNYPLLLRALREGLVVPAFRDRSTDEFAGTLRTLQSSGIVGAYARDHEDKLVEQQELARRLDGAWREGPAKQPRFWPDNLGEAFDKGVTATLLRPAVPFADEHRLEDWESTEELRPQLLQDARARSARLGGERAGVRRGELFNALGQHYGVVDDDGLITLTLAGWTSGNAVHDGDERGWFVGGFVDPANPNFTKDVEVKWSVHAAGEARPEWGSSPLNSLTILVSGAMRLTFPDDEVLLHTASDYVIWQAGVKHTWRAEQPTTVVTVRWSGRWDPDAREE
jgi:hypothetical protein